jgi:flagellar protein FliO/FliZ
MFFWIFMTILLAAGGVAAVLGYRYFLTGDLGLNLPGWFQQKPAPRLGVSEHIMVDSRRKLLLIRRDGVEHLVLTGGPVDLLIETGIRPPEADIDAGYMPQHDDPMAALTEPPPSQPVFTRPPRSFGQAVNE